MTEDPRISEIREALSGYYDVDADDLATDGAERELDDARRALDRIRAILDRPAPVAQPVDWPAVAEAFADEIAELNPPAPRVFFPGDTVPPGTYLLNDGGGVLMPRDEPWEVLGLRRAYIELIVPSPEEWQAAVDRARNKPVNPADSGHQEVPS